MTWSFQRNNDHFDDLTKRDNLGGSYKIVLDNNDRNVIGNSEPDVKRNWGSTVLYFMDEWKGLINIYLENIQSLRWL